MVEMLPFVMCPVCSTRQDADGWGAQNFVCDNCGTQYTVLLEPDKVAMHAIAG